MNSQDFRNLQEAYLDVYQELDEGAAQNVADRARKLANQRKGQTPERKKILQDLEYKADERANPKPEADWRTGISDSSRKMNVSTYADRDKVKIKTTNPKKLRKQKAMGELKDSFDLYDIILSHLLDEGYADTEDSALVIMANMSEDWRDSICENVTSGKGRVRNIQSKPTGLISNRELNKSSEERKSAENIRINKAGDEAHAKATTNGMSFSDAQTRRTAAQLRARREIARSYR
jgi:hypothetical protein